jgi:hypothetical protein
MTDEMERYVVGGLSPAQRYADMDPLERLLAETENAAAEVAHERRATERRIRETEAGYRRADEEYSRRMSDIKRRIKKERRKASPGERHELMQLGAARASLEWQLTTYRDRHAELVESDRVLDAKRLDLEIAAREMQVKVDVVRSRETEEHALWSAWQINQTAHRLDAEIDHRGRAGADAIDRSAGRLEKTRPLSGRLDRVAYDIERELDSDY